MRRALCFVLCALCFRLLVFGLWSLQSAVALGLKFLPGQRPKTLKPKTQDQRPKTKDQSTKTVFLLKLFQKPDVVLEKQADVVKFVHQRAHAIDAKAKSKTGKLFRIDAGCA